MKEEDVHPSWEKYPQLFAELDLSKNKDLTYYGDLIHVYELSAGTNKRLDWKCSTCDHKWSATGNNRLAGKGCSYCNNSYLHSDGRNSMAITIPN